MRAEITHRNITRSFFEIHKKVKAKVNQMFIDSSSQKHGSQGENFAGGYNKFGFKPKGKGKKGALIDVET
ncbi:MAG: hypothetical protein ABH854_00665 [Candidatus Diapherotrites archaeon]|nr:hypothetical protein [Candidatus Micrarchaeota archaeon]MBU1940046.1 hypothetical protein [Candidatus Micrarchaeota archaeon]